MARGASTSLRVLFIVAAVVVAVLLLASAVQAAGELRQGDEVVTVEYKVRTGDSLWTIAEANTAADGDVRTTVDAIRRVNRLSGSTIHAGQVLAIPSS